jgi:hypothetical protein
MRGSALNMAQKAEDLMFITIAMGMTIRHTNSNTQADTNKQ